MYHLQFFPSYLEEVSLPVELENEPYSFEDNGYRPEITKRRTDFFFQVTARAVCTIGRKRIIGPLQRAISPGATHPVKSSTKISVLTVYDTYGLAIAHKYLESLYYRSQVNPEWILVYLVGSLYAIDPSITEDVIDSSKYHILYLCTLIMRGLENMDKREPKMMGQLSDVPEGTLPADILSAIIGSRRVSKAIASDVQDRVCNEALGNYR